MVRFGKCGIPSMLVFARHGTLLSNLLDDLTEAIAQQPYVVTAAGAGARRGLMAKGVIACCQSLRLIALFWCGL